MENADSKIRPGKNANSSRCGSMVSHWSMDFPSGSPRSTVQFKAPMASPTSSSATVYGTLVPTSI
eukprot:2125763-Pyramimonas_sp.AAC.1